MNNDSANSPCHLLVEATKLVSIIALRFVYFVDTRQSLSLFHILEFHVQGNYFPVYIIKSFILFLWVDCTCIFALRKSLPWGV